LIFCIKPPAPLFFRFSYLIHKLFENVFAMKDRPSENKSKFRKMIRNTWFWILTGLAVMVALFFIMLPVGIDYAIERYLKDQGADLASLADVDFNPFTGRMRLTDLTVTIGTQTALKFPEATFKIRGTPFIRKRFVMERFTISDTELIVEELENGNWQIGGIIIPGKKEPVAPAAWDFSFQEATAKNCQIKFISAQLKFDLAIEQAKISKLTSWMPEASARFELIGKLNDGNLQLQIDATPFAKEMMAAGRIQLKGLSLTPFAQLLKPHIKAIEGRLDADLNIETRQTAAADFSHHQKGRLNLQQIRTQIEGADFSNDGLAWDGALRLDIPKSEGALKISADGQLKGSKIKLAMPNENIKIQQDNLSWKGKIDYAQDKTNENIKAGGQIVFHDVKMEYPEVNLAEEKLSWKGALQFSSTAKAGGQRIIADGTLDSSHLRVSLLNRKLKFEHHGLSWNGRLRSGETNDFSALKAEADVILNDIEILHSETNQRLLNSNRIGLQAINVEGLNDVTVSVVAFNGLELVTPHDTQKSPSGASPLFQVQEVNLKNVRLSLPQDFAIDAIHLRGVKAFLHRNPEGKWSAANDLNAIRTDIFSSDQKGLQSAERSANSGSDAKEKPSDFGFRIGQLDITGDNVLRFEDESVSPTFGIDLSLLEARLSDLDSRQPEKSALVKLRVSDKEQARLSLDGSIQPFAERLSLDWVAKIESLELAPLSPYVIQNTGYRFVNGEMQADIPLKINQNKLNGEINLLLNNPIVKIVKAEDPEKEKQGKIQLNMPLDSALKLLRDKQNNVKLNIPVSGDISDPKFSFTEAINRVLAQTLQTSALSYLKFMLGPYGIGLAVAEQAIKGASKIRLNPILFAPGSDELNDATNDYTQRVAAILKEHPAVQVRVCGAATESDRAAMNGGTPAEPAAQTDASRKTDDALLTLAEKRSERIQNQLVNGYGIAAKRIIVCKPKIDRAANAKPRVNLEI
jgi:outer membrane protein OmpA-like peptidoglycan-associated protein